MRPNCKKCNTPLTGKVRYNHTTCPNCGKRWRLNEDNTDIYTTVLEVHDTTHGQKTEFLRSNENG